MYGTRTSGDLVERGDGARRRALAEPGESGGAGDGGKECEASEGAHDVRGEPRPEKESEKRVESW